MSLNFLHAYCILIVDRFLVAGYLVLAELIEMLLVFELLMLQTGQKMLPAGQVFFLALGLSSSLAVELKHAHVAIEKSEVYPFFIVLIVDEWIFAEICKIEFYLPLLS